MEKEYFWWEAGTLKRVNIFVEGQTEETFVREVLYDYFLGLNILMRG